MIALLVEQDHLENATRTRWTVQLFLGIGLIFVEGLLTRTQEEMDVQHVPAYGLSVEQAVIFALGALMIVTENGLSVKMVKLKHRFILLNNK